MHLVYLAAAVERLNSSSETAASSGSVKFNEEA
jgi:hypothetical protein